MLNEWDAVDFATVELDTYPPALVEREQWMGRLASEKRTLSPWGDRDHPAAADKDARYKRSLTEHYAEIADDAREKLADGDRYRGGWWRLVVRPGLEALNDVEKLPRGGSD